MLARSQEETANGLSHLCGVLFCLASMPFLISKALKDQNEITLVGVIAFGIGMFFVYLFSTLYHLVRNEKRKKKLKIADHISIYFLIAGTYSPLMLRYLSTNMALAFLGGIWLLVFLGALLKLVFKGRFRKAAVIMYILMGWLIVLVIKPLWGVMPFEVFLWILAGGLSYMIGVYFYWNSHKKYYHTIWHMFVLMGTLLHYIAIFQSL